MPTARARTRARDLDRTEVCGALDLAYAEGQLDGEEHRRRTAAAMSATRVAELRALVADLQLQEPVLAPPEPVARPAKPTRPLRSRPGRTLIGGILIAVIWAMLISVQARGIGDGPAGPAPRSPAVPAEAPDVPPGVDPVVVPPVALHTTDGFRRFVDALRAEFGTTEVDDATIHSDRAYVLIPRPDDPRRLQSVVYEGGFGAPIDTGLLRDPASPLVDLATIDPDAVLALVAGAEESLNMPGPSPRHLIVRDMGQGPTVSIYAIGEAMQIGVLEVRPDGTTIRMQPFQPR